MANSFLAGVTGDGQFATHRTALAGNAMLFGQMWVKLTAGADSIPQLHSTLPYTYIISYYIQSGTVQQNIITQDNSPFAYVQGFLLWRQFTQYYTGRENSSTQLYRHTHSTTGLPNARRTILLRNFSRLNTATEIDLQQGRSIAFTRTDTAVKPQNLTINHIDIGRRNGLVLVPNSLTFTEPFVGYVRSVEILTRHLTSTEQRQVFNFGTAHAAGLITNQDISIDFNRVNGQIPICRAGSRQLTVTAYNNTTPDTAGTTYADFYSL